MRKFFLTILSVALAATSVFAQEVAKKPSFKGFETNGFWSNIEVSGGLGIGTAFTNRPDLGAHSERFGIQGHLSVTKWLHPVVGLRAELQGGEFKNFHPTYGKMEWPYLFGHIDVMVNLSNWIGGYREDRVYYAVPYVGGGYLATNFTNSSKRANHSGAQQDLALAYGLLNKFRVSQRFDVNLELKGLLVQGDVCPAELKGAYLYGWSATVGVTYRFKNRGWVRKNAAAELTAEQLRQYQAAATQAQRDLDDAKAENDRLNNELCATKDALEAAKARPQITVVEHAPKSLQATTTAGVTKGAVIFFDYASSGLSQKEETRLNLVAQMIKEGDKDQVYHLEGHADAQTGTSESNARIAERRAKAVYDYLIQQGVSKDQLTYKGYGDTKEPFSDQRANRSVVIIK